MARRLGPVAGAARMRQHRKISVQMTLFSQNPKLSDATGPTSMAHFSQRIDLTVMPFPRMPNFDIIDMHDDREALRHDAEGGTDGRPIFT